MIFAHMTHRLYWAFMAYELCHIIPKTVVLVEGNFYARTNQNLTTIVEKPSERITHFDVDVEPEEDNMVYLTPFILNGIYSFSASIEDPDSVLLSKFGFVKQGPYWYYLNVA